MLGNLHVLREQVGDRAILRALHFLGDNKRVTDQVAALKSGNFQHFLGLVSESGNSSFKWLQNIYSVNNVHEQGVSLALALTESYLHKIGAGACRVHGGGFAGTIQVFLPDEAVQDYLSQMDTIFGQKKVLVLSIRAWGTLKLTQ